MATRKVVSEVMPDAVAEDAVIPSDSVDLHDMDFNVVARHKNNSLLEKDHARKALADVYRKEPKRSVMVAPMYAPYFGKVMHVMINGCSIAVPCDGRPYDIPETFAGEVFRRINKINDQQSKAKRYSDVSTNLEGAPGELALF